LKLKRGKAIMTDKNSKFGINIVYQVSLSLILIIFAIFFIYLNTRIINNIL